MSLTHRMRQPDPSWVSLYLLIKCMALSDHAPIRHSISQHHQQLLFKPVTMDTAQRPTSTDKTLHVLGVIAGLFYSGDFVTDNSLAFQSKQDFLTFPDFPESGNLAAPISPLSKAGHATDVILTARQHSLLCRALY